MAEERIPAENPTQALFDLAGEMADNYHKIRYIKIYAYLFLGFTLLGLFLLIIAVTAEGNYALALIFAALLVSGAVLLRLLIFTKNFLDHFDKNFRAIRKVYDTDPMPQIPKGRNLIDRIGSYLRDADPETSYVVKKEGRLLKDFNSGNVTWPLAVRRIKKFFGRDSYLLLVDRKSEVPSMKDLVVLEKKIEETVKKGAVPDRIICVCKSGRDYDGITDDLYVYLTEKEHRISVSGKSKRIKMQLFLEVGDRYEIIPLLP